MDKQTLKELEALSTPNPEFPVSKWTEMTKIVITIPNSIEEGTVIDMLGEIKRDNPDYIITVCKTCDECGATNDTVEEVEIHSDVDEGRPKPVVKKLCDYCGRF